MDPRSVLSNRPADVVSHPWEHLSDILAGFIVRRYGCRKYGTHAVPVSGQRTVFVGRGGYDEHRDPALAKECEATLAAADLGVEKERGLAPFLRYTRLVDTAGLGKTFGMLGRVVELLPRVHQDSSWRTRQWAELFFEAFVAVYPRRMAYRRAYPDSHREMRRALKHAFERAVGQKHRIDNAERYVRSKIQRLFLAEPRLPFPAFSLLYCAEVIALHLRHRFRRHRQGRNIARRAVIEWLADAIRAEIGRQRIFIKAGPASLSFGNFEEACVLIDGEEFLLLLVESDEEAIHSRLFADSRSVAMVVARRSPRANLGHTRGQVQALTRRSVPSAGFVERFDDFTALVRALEQDLRGEQKSTWSELVAQSEPPGAKIWFYHHGLRALFNGARSAPDMEPTLVLNKQIVECMRLAFDDEHWRYRNEFRASCGGEPLPEPQFREEWVNPDDDDNEEGIEGTK
ncbi:hypothetical protein A3A38_04210 [Candidatus Kaiserbacteria bacterium RIFCSPLOWO2_01_FULL_53_17]|uniref:Uncharacterized protein n=1 Tax=Candidatus Kaiserbacteria bacterium RIFCSPLOWO2_01_FULL_53_17 TaxID=1798511 RepID=A0A1F6EH09_9BACT|nr:MAG: hypothetical protein A3A38_04210 [Candidatus Kaiserbacteria bacterium RIFCSPLOWO2_01_FULL_53_17]